MYALQEKKTNNSLKSDKEIDEKYLVSIQKDYVIKGWEVCRAKGLKRNKRKETKKYTGQKLKKLLNKNEELINYTKPFMDNLYHFVKNTGFAVILADSNSCILEVVGDNEIIKDSEDSDNFKIGTLWLEEYVGNTAINTAIHEEKPVQILGNEHYYLGYKNWTCSAAPIKK